MEYVYAALLLHKIGKEVNEENIKKVVAATGTEMGDNEEAKAKSLATSLKGVDIDKELENAVLTSAAPSVESPVGDEEEKKEKQPKEEKEEAASEGLSALFG